ncbi:hypothetical protein PINS_up008835 [Pythium insidiosum]|nr:hypothetical protein PINS_up008835 [Pythium insidiosum]
MSSTDEGPRPPARPARETASAPARRHSQTTDKRRRVSAPSQTPKERPFTRKWTLYAPPPMVSPTLRIVSFNVLADYIVARDGALNGDAAWKYEWDYRRRRLLREILSWHAHIVCLQEVDHYDDFFAPELRKHGFVGVFKKRTGDETQDGCAIFVQSKMLSIVSTHPLEYFESDDALLNRHNVALQVVVEWRRDETSERPRRFIVANTHLLFNPGRGDVKLAQLQRLLSSLAELRRSESTSSASSDREDAAPLPVILCGDFNLMPHSALYEFLSRRSLDVSGLSKHFLSGQNMDHRQANAVFQRENDTTRHRGHGTAVGRFNSSRARRTYLHHFPRDTIVSHEVQRHPCSVYMRTMD